VFVMIHYEAKIHNIQGSRSGPTAMVIFKREWYYMTPLLLITIVMLSGFSPGFAAVTGIISCVAVSWVKTETRMGVTGFIEAACKGTENSLKIGGTVGVIGIIISVLTFSGLILTFANIVIELAAGSLFLTILFIALASLVLGMGVPVTAAYLITAVIAVPALTHLGVNLIAAHMIVYWLSQDSNISPPVCIAAFAGAAIAKANMWRTAFSAFKFAKFLYIAPFLFGYVPEFTLNGSWWDILLVFTVITIGNYLFAYLLSFSWWHSLKDLQAKA
ncbi:MAG: TRAP transporter large permease subunit, partial [Gammaproteobacteria bacterium]|nr:TRAP transporter large permease subunit [Gammaproteobacteria bacterium]